MPRSHAAGNYPGSSAPCLGVLRQSALQAYGSWLWIPQNLNFAPKMQVWAMHAWPFLHSALCSQSCAVAKPDEGAEHEPPTARAWHVETAVNVDGFSAPQQLCPPGQSHAYWQCTGASPLLHVAVLPAMHRPVGLREIVTQQVLDRTSHVDEPLQTSCE